MTAKQSRATLLRFEDQSSNRGKAGKLRVFRGER